MSEPKRKDIKASLGDGIRLKFEDVVSMGPIPESLKSALVPGEITVTCAYLPDEPEGSCWCETCGQFVPMNFWGVHQAFHTENAHDI